MKALVFEKGGIDNLEVKEVESPYIGRNDVLIEVKMAGVNPVDAFTVSSGSGDPMPHIPGVEYAGIVKEVGSEVSNVDVGDKVTVYNRVYDASCKLCNAGLEMLCERGGILGMITNGGFAEEVTAPAMNVEKIPNGVSWELAASLPVAALTPYHALNRANLDNGENFVVFGASGNTGMFGVQIGEQKGANVYAISSKKWVTDFGAKDVFGYQEAGQRVEEATNGNKADVVLNSIGQKTWETSLNTLGVNGRLVFFGALTGHDVNLPLNSIYGKQQQIIGSTGGTRKEFKDLVNNSQNLTVKVWKIFELGDGVDALKSLNSSERDGRIMIKP